MINRGSLSLDAPIVSKELTLLLKFVTEQSSQEIHSAISHDLDWNHFLELAKHHRLYPILYSKVKEQNSSIVPSFVVQTLYQEYQKNTFNMLRLTAEIERISSHLHEKKIEHLYLKGPVLAMELYQDLSRRTSKDLDILIDIKNLEKVAENLKTLGYVESAEQPRNCYNGWKWRNHHLVFIHPQKEIAVEIHWKLNPGPSKKTRFNELWERKRCCFFAKSPIYYLGKEDLFCFLINHGSRHGWFRLRWLLDIDQMLKQDLDYQTIIQMLAANNWNRLAGQTLLLSSHLLDTPIKKELRFLLKSNHARKLADEALFIIQEKANLDSFSHSLSLLLKEHLYILSIKSIFEKITFLLGFLFPNRKDEEVLPLPKQLYLLYFPLRPFLWAWRKLRKQALQ